MRWSAAFLRGSARHRSPNSINSVTSIGVGPSKHAPMNCRDGRQRLRGEEVSKVCPRQ